MDKQIINFTTTTKNGIITQIGRSTILQPKLQFKGGSVKWFDDTKLLKSPKSK